MVMYLHTAHITVSWLFRVLYGATLDVTMYQKVQLTAPFSPYFDRPTHTHGQRQMKSEIEVDHHTGNSLTSHRLLGTNGLGRDLRFIVLNRDDQKVQAFADSGLQSTFSSVI